MHSRALFCRRVGPCETQPIWPTWSGNGKAAVRERVASIHGRTEDVLTRVVEEGKASGDFPADLPVKDTVTSIIAAVVPQRS